MNADQKTKPCPLADVDRRLDDVHQQWHQAERAYFDPNQFRIAIQSAIQTLRSVTFVLQKHKKKIPNFDVWYGAWQKRLGSEFLLMTWMKNARNKIEKEGDLEAHSFVRAEIVASYLDEGPKVDVRAELFDFPLELIKKIPKGEVLQHIRKNGALKIERRWVENSLPDYELLEAVAVAYGRVAELINDAHKQIGLETPKTIDAITGHHYATGMREGRMPCMVSHGDQRSMVFRLSDGRPLQFEEQHHELKEIDAEKAKDRYGDIHKGMFGPPGASEEEMAASLFKTAQKVFLRDGYHEFIYFLFRERKLVNLVALRPGDQLDKYLMMRGLASTVLQYSADAIIGINEAWVYTSRSSKAIYASFSISSASRTASDNSRP